MSKFSEKEALEYMRSKRADSNNNISNDLKRIEAGFFVNKAGNSNHKMMDGFSKATNRISLNPNLSPYEKAVFNVLLTRSMNKNFCFPSQKTIAKEAGCGLTKAKSVLKSLEVKGLIKKRKNPRYRSNEYEIPPHIKSPYDHNTSHNKAFK